MTSTPIEILLVEDNPGDVGLTRESFRRAKVINNVSVARDGVEALEMLGHEGPASIPRPDLILLDLNLPRKNGHEVLQAIKSNPHLSQIPVVILTSSHAEEDIAKSYELRANSYVTKPVLWSDFQKVITAMEGFWLTVVRLPPKVLP